MLYTIDAYYFSNIPTYFMLEKSIRVFSWLYFPRDFFIITKAVVYSAPYNVPTIITFLLITLSSVDTFILSLPGNRSFVYYPTLVGNYGTAAHGYNPVINVSKNTLMKFTVLNYRTRFHIIIKKYVGMLYIKDIIYS